MFLRIFRALAEDFTGFGDVVREIKFSLQKLQFLDTQFGGVQVGQSRVDLKFMLIAQNMVCLLGCLFEAGKDLNVGAGCPNLIERIEGGYYLLDQI